jgi:hypothetical protein
MLMLVHEAPNRLQAQTANTAVASTSQASSAAQEADADKAATEAGDSDSEDGDNSDDESEDGSDSDEEEDDSLPVSVTGPPKRSSTSSTARATSTTFPTTMARPARLARRHLHSSPFRRHRRTLSSPPRRDVSLSMMAVPDNFRVEAPDDPSTQTVKLFGLLPDNLPLNITRTCADSLEQPIHTMVHEDRQSIAFIMFELWLLGVAGQ